MNNIVNKNYPKTYYLVSEIINEINPNPDNFVTFHSEKEENESELVELERLESEMGFGSPMPLRNRLKMMDGLREFNC